MSRRDENLDLYCRGLQYALMMKGFRGSVEERIVRVAREENEGEQEVGTAIEFAERVNAIERIVGGAREVILSGRNPHLTPKNIALIAKRTEARISTAMKSALAGLHPDVPVRRSGKSKTQTPWCFDRDRLHDAVAILRDIERVVSGPGSLDDSELLDVATHMTAIRVATDAMRLALDDRNKSTTTPIPASPRSKSRAEVVTLASRARTLIEKVTGDLLRASHTRSLDAVREDLRQAVRAAASGARRILEDLPANVTSVPAPRVINTRDGPDRTKKGTYVVVFHAERPNVVRIGDLGTFWIPSGFLLYVGSAFGSGGVLARTSRHQKPHATLRWNLDHLKRVAHPVEVWWMYNDRLKPVECKWAMALASMQVCCCPVPRFGGNDCKRCPAHLYRTQDRPSIKAFARKLGLNGTGGDTIHWQAAAATGEVK